MESLEYQTVFTTAASNGISVNCAKWFGERLDGLINEAGFSGGLNPFSSSFIRRHRRR